MTAEKAHRDQAPAPDLPIWARERPQRRPALSRDIVADAAVQIADAEGLDAVSIRRVTGDLGVRPMSLYTYIDRKEDLLALMRDRVHGETLFGTGLPDGWRDALTAIARRTREVMLRHRWMVDIAAHSAAPGPNALRHYEESSVALRDLDLSPQLCAEVLFTVDKYVLGHVSFEVAGSSVAVARNEMLPYLKSLLATGEFPMLSRMAADGMVLADTVSRFERGLSWLLDGIEANITA